mgnify:FL=1
MCGELVDNVVEKMSPLIVDELYRASKPTPQMFINEFCRGRGCVVTEGLSLDPFCTIVSCMDDILVPGPSHGWFKRSNEI